MKPSGLRSRVVLLGCLIFLILASSHAATVPGEFVYTGHLNSARSFYTATLLDNGSVLIAGGDTGTGALATAELYNPVTGVFTFTGSMHFARAFHTATLLNNGTVLIAGGTGAAPTASAELYNPSTGTFTVTGSLSVPHSRHTATLLPNGMVLVAGGLTTSGADLTTAELYDPSKGTFSVTGSMITGRREHTATLLNTGMVLVAGGMVISFGDRCLPSAELFNPSTGLFTATGSLQQCRYDHTATLLNNGTVLIVGGVTINGMNFLHQVELYNPSTGTFSFTGSLNYARTQHTATLLNNGTVLVAGGSPQILVAEIYDPSTGAVATTGSLNTARVLPTATLLNNGNVVVVGGSGLATAELYQPTSLVPSGLISISIALSPPFPWVPIGSTYNLTALGTFPGGVVETLASVTWSSSSSVIASVTNDSGNRGHAFGMAAGSSTVEACTGTICGSTLLSVAPHSNIVIGGPTSGATFETYDDNGSLLQTGNLSVSRSNHSATLLSNGTIFVAGGIGASGSWQILDVNGQEAFSGTLLNGFYSHFAVRLANGNIFLGGGVSSPQAWEIRNPAGAFVSSGALLGKRTPGAGAVALKNGNIWIAGSGGGTLSDQCSWEIHDINGNLVSNGTLNTCFVSAKAFLLSNEDIVYIGGTASPSTYEIYTPTGAFVRQGNLINAFDSGSGAVLVNNNIFIFEQGFWEYVGFDANGNNTFDSIGTLHDDRTSARAAVTSSGNIFITGGFAAPGTWEIWTPSGTTATLKSFGNLFDARGGGHSDTHF